jgi:archaemetzincin
MLHGRRAKAGRIGPIFLQPLFRGEEKLFSFLRRELSRIFRTAVLLRSPIPMPSKAWGGDRHQHNAELVLASFVPPAGHPGACLLLVAVEDLFVPGLNFVFGLADRLRRRAIVSLARLRPEFYGEEPDESIYFARALKEAVHELGHLMGLGHCSNPRCVMFFSNSLVDTDRKHWEFCDRCRTHLGL